MPPTALPHRKADAYTVVASRCPQPITGRTYLGVWADRGQRIIRCYRYDDGAYRSTLGSYDYSTAGWSLTGIAAWQRAHAAGDVVVFEAVSTLDNTTVIVTWTPASSAVHALFTGLHAGGPCVVGHNVWFIYKGEPGLQLYRVPLRSAGPLPEDAAVGDPLPDANNDLAVPGVLLHSGGETFQVPCFWFGEGGLIRVPYFAEGAWHMGVGRELVSGSADTAPVGNGQAVGADYSLRPTYRPGYAPELGLLPRGSRVPHTPEIGLLPPEAGIEGIGELSVSPSTAEAAVFPCWLAGETGDDRMKLFRLGTAAPYQLVAGCPLPRIAVEPGPDPHQPPENPLGYPEALLARD